MTRVTRSQFLGNALLMGGALTSTGFCPEALAQRAVVLQAVPIAYTSASEVQGQPTSVGFRYSPASLQTTYCFPDDPHRILIDESGTLLYGYDREKSVYCFPLRTSFALYGIQETKVLRQIMWSSSVSLLRTELERTDATMTLPAIATDDPDEDRVENVSWRSVPRNGDRSECFFSMRVYCAQKFGLKPENQILTVAN